MAAPEKYVDYEFLDDGLGQDIQWSSPQIGGVTAAPTLNQSDQAASGGWVFEWPATAGALYGARKVLPATRDISSRRFVWCSGFTNQYATVLKLADLADGGVRFYLTDSAGAYRGWTLYGRDISGTNPNPGYAFGSFLQFNNFVDQMWWCIDLERTPDYSSGTLDLTDIVAVEVHIQNHATISNTNPGRFACGFICASDEPTIRAGEVADPADFSALVGTLAPWNTTSNLFYPGGARQAQSLAPTFDGANGQIYNTVSPIHVGDGSTATYFRQGRGQIANQLSLDTVAYRIAQGETPALLGPYLPAASGRVHTINQSASDDVEIADFVWSGYDNPDRVYAFEVTGSTSGSCSLLRNSFFRADFVKLAHAQTEDCLFDACNNVEITADTGMTGATIRNAPSGTTALTIAGAAGDYSGVDARLNNPSATYDIALGSGGAGTYDLTGITVPDGYTLKLRNDSATNAITVKVALGITTSTSTAGGTITVEQAVVQSTASIEWTQTGSSVQVYNVTSATEIYAEAAVSGTSWSLSYTPPTSFDVGDTVRVRIRKAGYEPIEATAIVGSTGWSVFGDQVVDSRYTATTPANYSIDYTDKKIRATGARAQFLAQEIVDIVRQAETTLDGIRLPEFATVSGLVTLSPGVSTALTVELEGWQVSWASGSVAQATVGGGNVVGGISGDPVEDVVGGPQVTVNLSAAATQVSVGSGVLPSDITAIAAAVLSAAQAAPIHSDIRKVNNYVVDGSGTTGDPWGPV